MMAKRPARLARAPNEPEASQSDEEPVGALSGIGPFSTRALAEIGVVKIGDLRNLGAVEAYARLRFVHGKGVTLNMLTASTPR
jgi:predicted flap endonuclease-1-like 5' DNA nuclease